jgi:hypothetical protein
MLVVQVAQVLLCQNLTVAAVVVAVARLVPVQLVGLHLTQLL